MNTDLITLTQDGSVEAEGKTIAVLEKSADALFPTLKMKPYDDAVAAKIKEILTKALEPVLKAKSILDEEKASGKVRGIVFQVTEKFGTMEKDDIKDYFDGITDEDKKVLAKAGLRVGFKYVFFPLLLKPASQKILAMLWKINNDFRDFKGGVFADGKMSLEVEKNVPKGLYIAQGYIPAGKRALRVDVMERFTAKLREITRQDKEKAVPLPLDLLSTAGLKRDEAADIFDRLGFLVITKDDTLMLMPKFKRKQKKTDPKQAEKTADSSDSPFSILKTLKKP